MKKEIIMLAIIECLYETAKITPYTLYTAGSKFKKKRTHIKTKKHTLRDKKNAFYNLRTNYKTQKDEFITHGHITKF